MMRCAVFIDGNNIFHSARQLGFEVDYAKLLAVLVGKDRELLRAFFYTGVDEGADRQRGFLHWMRRNGFRVIQKPTWRWRSPRTCWPTPAMWTSSFS